MSKYYTLMNTWNSGESSLLYDKHMHQYFISALVPVAGAYAELLLGPRPKELQIHFPGKEFLPISPILTEIKMKRRYVALAKSQGSL